jgi:CheY-like chemotaxis protein
MKRILIIEDDPLIADVCSQQLRAEGFAVDVAADGKAGLEIFNGRRADLVVLDLILPKMDGVEVLKTIRSQAGLREVPVIVFTNSYLDGRVQSAWEAGASQVLAKTAYTPRQIVQIVKIALDPGLKETPGSTAAVPVDPTSAINLMTRKKFLKFAPEAIDGLRCTLDNLANDPENPSQLQELRAKIRPLVTTAAIAGLQPITRMAEALEGLLKVLGEKSGSVTLSVLLTITQAIDTLEYLFDNSETVAHPDPSQHPGCGRQRVCPSCRKLRP